MSFATMPSSPAAFYPLAGRLVPWFAGAALLLTLAALAIGVLLAPPAEEMGGAYAIVFLHVPAAWMSLLLYVLAVGCAALTLHGSDRLPALVLAAVAPAGVLFTLLALWTGSLWGGPGDAWSWDARLTCELILFLLYVSILALRTAIEDALQADRACAVLVLVGALNIPIIYFSVSWWSATHEEAAAGVASSPALFGGMLVMALAFWMVANALVLARMRHLMREPGVGCLKECT